MSNKIGGPWTRKNVIGEIRGRGELPDEAVILGAHLDSWDLGTGALDNGCNAALVIEAARAIKASGLVPRRTIRSCLQRGRARPARLWQYALGASPGLDKVRAVVIFDSGIGRVSGYSLTGRADIEAGVREILKPLDSWDVITTPSMAISARTIGIFSWKEFPRWSQSRTKPTICLIITRRQTLSTKWTSANSKSIPR